MALLKPEMKQDPEESTTQRVDSLLTPPDPRAGEARALLARTAVKKSFPAPRS